MHGKQGIERLKRWSLMVAVPLLLFSLSYCGAEKITTASQDGYLNWNDTVDYVGMETCRLCHSQIYDDYIQTGMGRSFDHSTKEKSAAEYGPHQLVHDEASDLWYRPYWRDDSLRILEFRLADSPESSNSSKSGEQDTVHKREETVHYIIGSGQHTNSHLLERNGYVYQAPITYYTQQGKWDMAPGFEAGYNTRFERMIEEECMSCHNGLPQLTAGSVNKYEVIPQGIDCERCHGPGEAHVAQKSLGILVDTANEIDYSIVHPGKLSVEAQLDLCQRCHLQGVAVLNEGAAWDSYKPGMALKDHWNIFLPRQEAESERFLMASQAERLRKSKCYIESGAISCISCHNPHLSVKATPIARFNQPCQGCHNSGADCTGSLASRTEVADNCSSCHMPSAGSIDIPHVSITDHRIQVPGRKEAVSETISGLECLTDEEASSLTLAKGYLKFYEAFNSNAQWLDSADTHLAGSNEYGYELTATKIHAAFLAKEDAQLEALSETLAPENAKDGWTAYRLAEGLSRLGQQDRAKAYLTQAVSLEPLNLDFRYKLGNACVSLGDNKSASEQYRFILSEQPDHASAHSNLGFLRLQAEGASAIAIAERHFKTAIAADPDHLKAQLNLAQLYYFAGRSEEGNTLLRKLQRKFPNEAEVKLLVERSGI